jgi:hypothetical protein
VYLAEVADGAEEEFVRVILLGGVALALLQELHHGLVI